MGPTLGDRRDPGSEGTETGGGSRSGGDRCMEKNRGAGPVTEVTGKHQKQDSLRDSKRDRDPESVSSMSE